MKKSAQLVEERRRQLARALLTLSRRQGALRAPLTVSIAAGSPSIAGLYLDSKGDPLAGTALEKMFRDDRNNLEERGWLTIERQRKPHVIAITQKGRLAVAGAPPSPLVAALGYRLALAYAPDDVRTQLEDYYLWAKEQMVGRGKPVAEPQAADTIRDNVEVIQKGLRLRDPDYQFRADTLEPARRLPALLEALYPAIAGRTQLQITYIPKRARGLPGKAAVHEVQPLSLVFRHPKAYLVARHLREPPESPLVREYALNRVQDIHARTFQPFERPAGYTLRQRLDERGIESDTFRNSPRRLEKLQLRLYPDAYPGFPDSRIADDILESLPVSEKQQIVQELADGSFRVIIGGIRDTLELRQWLYSRLPTLVVEEPADLRTDMVSATRVWLERLA